MSELTAAIEMEVAFQGWREYDPRWAEMLGEETWGRVMWLRIFTWEPRTVEVDKRMVGRVYARERKRR